MAELLRLPDVRHAAPRVLVEVGALSRCQVLGQHVTEFGCVGDREVHALTARGRDDVRGVAEQEESLVPHRLAHPADHFEHVLAGHRALVEPPPRLAEPGAQLRPDALVRPVRHGVLERHLQVEPGHRVRTQQVSGEPALVLRVDGPLRRRRRLGQQREPAELVPHRVLPVRRRRHGRAAGTVLTVRAGHEPRPHHGAVRALDDRRFGGVEHLHRFAAVEHLAAARLERVEQVGHDLLLRVHVVRFVVVQRRVVREEALAVRPELTTGVHRALGVQSRGDAHLVEQLHGAVFQQAGPGPAGDLRAAELVEHQAGDAAAEQEIAQGEAGRPGADDGHGGLAYTFHREAPSAG